MRRTFGPGSALLFTLSAVACGVGEEAANQPAVESTVTDPMMAFAADWLQADSATETVTLDVIAGKDASNNYWNFNGYANGNVTITVPEGYAVTINFLNNDPNTAHSIGVTQRPTGPFSATPTPTPAFPGGMSSNPTSMTDATKTGATETITFTAATAGDYAMVCFVLGHATSGMWINFRVTSGGALGVEAPMAGL
jgi:FtsP/CotA-like multicopper oxidase with cupredoxin domain